VEAINFETSVVNNTNGSLSFCLFFKYFVALVVNKFDFINLCVIGFKIKNEFFNLCQIHFLFLEFVKILLYVKKL